MQNVIWDKPVVVGGKLVFGPLEARRFLMTDWPHKKDSNFAAADACILRALDGRASPDEARELFEAALHSAALVTTFDYKLAG
ncbi:hypothetical protein D3C87_1506070 [compost metagenome]|jgi:hypothetical protein|uniref:DUF982 domain-containing protein n=1 Tax=Rhizobium/Agrobacterium group TaxID=227290 RepID=UPI000FACD014|nr:DUF982 domain-containing protein [Agrobacterium sp. Ap1]MBO0145500.1 DUF982 domain-containing protein [Agrobacterium sp. Ap1]